MILGQPSAVIFTRRQLSAECDGHPDVEPGAGHLGQPHALPVGQPRAHPLVRLGAEPVGEPEFVG